MPALCRRAGRGGRRGDQITPRGTVLLVEDASRLWADRRAEGSVPLGMVNSSPRLGRHVLTGAAYQMMGTLSRRGTSSPVLGASAVPRPRAGGPGAAWQVGRPEINLPAISLVPAGEGAVGRVMIGAAARRAACPAGSAGLRGRGVAGARCAGPGSKVIWSGVPGSAPVGLICRVRHGRGGVVLCLFRIMGHDAVGPGGLSPQAGIRASPARAWPVIFMAPGLAHLAAVATGAGLCGRGAAQWQAGRPESCIDRPSPVSSDPCLHARDAWKR